MQLEICIYLDLIERYKPGSNVNKSGSNRNENA